MPTHESDIAIRWRTPATVVAAVRDPVSRVVDVRWTCGAGWSCTCADPRCCHIAAVRAVAAEEVVV